jgi:hypothetical protein
MHTSDAAHEFALIDNGERSCDIGRCRVHSTLVHKGGHFACFHYLQAIASCVLLVQYSNRVDFLDIAPFTGFHGLRFATPLIGGSVVSNNGYPILDIITETKYPGFVSCRIC